MQMPLADWLREFFVDRTEYPSPTVRMDAVRGVQLALRLDPGLQMGQELPDLMSRTERDPDLFLDVLDWALHNIMRYYAPGYPAIAIEHAKRAEEIFREGGSAWEVVTVGGNLALSRRAVGPVRDAILALPASSRAHGHLVSAWNKIAGRQPDPTGAYREAVRAVEAVAKPVVLPDAARATLGTMIAAMRDKPEKWTTSLGTVEDVRQMMQVLWTNQTDRHGTDDDAAPMNVTSEEADAAVHLALTLTRFFSGGQISRV